MTSTATGQTFLLPDLGEGLTEAEVVHWLVAEGDVVTIDQPVVEVETAKSVVEVPSPYAGRVGRLHAAEGELVEVGRPLITVGPEVEAEVEVEAAPVDGASVDGASAAAETYREEEQAGSGNVLIGYGTSAGAASVRRRRPRGARPAVPAAVPAAVPDAVPAAVPDDRPVKVISPIVRRLAREAGLDLRTIRPTGSGGVVNRSDVWAAVERARSAAAAAPGHAGPASAGPVSAVPVSVGTAPVGTAVPPEPVTQTAPDERRIPLTGFQRAASRVLSRSRSEIPEATVWVDVDATALWDLREAARTPADPGPGLLAYLARFVVAGLKEYPVLNARLDVERDEIVVPDAINLGVAVQSELGLVAPAVLGAGTMTTAELDAALRDLTARARVGKATAEELTAGTFTLNNYGGFRVDGSAAIINHPQVAILGLGRIIDRPWVVDGQIVPRKIAQMSFVFDHRVCDGATAAGFIRSVADAVENPAAAIVRL